jgi:uncharacterized membrane protein HdeD (DUF308 family)
MRERGPLVIPVSYDQIARGKVMRFVDKAAGWLVCLLGIAHLAVGYVVFNEPTEQRVWFMSAGLLLIMVGLANLAAQAQSTRMNSLAGAVGGASILMIGTLLALANPRILFQPQTLILLVLGFVLTGRRVHELSVTTHQR